jgi:hypothetical protein
MPKTDERKLSMNTNRSVVWMRTGLPMLMLATLGVVGAEPANHRRLLPPLEWCYLRQGGTMAYIMRNDTLPVSEKAYSAHDCNAFLFHYWLAAYSDAAIHAPITSFETLYFRLVAAQVAPFVSKDDPLRIKGAYENGKLKQHILTWADLPIEEKDFDTWPKYQSFVRPFDQFVDDRRAKIKPQNITRPE